ncbi:MAG: hypothetical protein WDW36_008405 [Sanguina aurantia]
MGLMHQLMRCNVGDRATLKPCRPHTSTQARTSSAQRRCVRTHALPHLPTPTTQHHHPTAAASLGRTSPAATARVAASDAIAAPAEGSETGTDPKRPKASIYLRRGQNPDSLSPEPLSRARSSARLSAWPPGSERWDQWVDALTTVPGITRARAEASMHKQTHILSLRADAAPARLAQLADLLKREAGIAAPEFATAILYFLHMATVQVETARASLRWLREELGCSTMQINKVVLDQQGLLMYTDERKRHNLRGILEQGVSLAMARECIVNRAQILVISRELLEQRVAVLSAEFGCSRGHVLRFASHALQRDTTHLRSRASFLRYLGSGEVPLPRVTIGGVWANTSDRYFADKKMRMYARETAQTLAHVCQGLQGLPGMAQARSAAGLQHGIETELDCLQAHRCLWDAGEWQEGVFTLLNE